MVNTITVKYKNKSSDIKRFRGIMKEAVGILINKGERIIIHQNK